MAINGILLDGGLTFNTYLHNDEGNGGLKSEDFSLDVTYGWTFCIFLQKHEKSFTKAATKLPASVTKQSQNSVD